MNARIIFAAIIFICAVAWAQPIGENFSIEVANIPDDDQGFDVRAQCWNDGDGSFRIYIDQDSIDDPQINRIVAHEIGHVVNWEGDEEDADNFANSVVDDGSEPIVDAYHGEH
jgi:uncharacterized protein YjaZ